MAPADGTRSLNDLIAELFIAHGIDLLRVQAGISQQILQLLRQLEEELAGTINRIDPMGVSERYRPKRLRSLLDQVHETIRGSYREAATSLRGDLRELASIEAEFVARVVNGEAGVVLMDGVIAPERLKALVSDLTVHGAPVQDWWGRQGGDTLNRFSDQMRLGMAAGETNSQLIQRLRGGIRDGVPITGVMPTARHHADSLVRSATQAVSEAAKEQVYEANADILGAVVWTATLDSRTTLECAARDGLRYGVKDKKPIGHDLPWGAGPGQFHWGCRSASRPETKSWAELGLDIEDLPPATRASMDGQVAGDLKFEDWLKKQTPERQGAVLGRGRAELWREGRISLRDMLNQEGRPLSLEQLRERL